MIAYNRSAVRINYNLYSFEGLKILRFYWLYEVWPIVCL